jgi:hypothetical protein
MASKIIDLTDTNLILSSIQEDLSKSSETLVQLQTYITTPEEWYLKFAPALIGLGGVLLGAVISFGFNYYVYKRDQRAKFAVQRKNLIFGKLYKELLNANDIIKKLPKDSFYCRFMDINTQGEDWGYDEFHFATASFKKPQIRLYKEMTEDIRITQIPVRIRNALSTLNATMSDYQNTLVSINFSLSTIGKKHRVHLSTESIEGAFYVNATHSDVVAKSLDHIASIKESDPERASRIQKEILDLLETNVFSEARSKFTTLNNYLSKSLSLLKEEIDTIVTRYEYGDIL